MLFCSAGQFIKRGVLLLIGIFLIAAVFEKAGIEWILPFFAWLGVVIFIIFVPTLVWIIFGYTLKFIIEKILRIKTTQEEVIGGNVRNHENIESHDRT